MSAPGHARYVVNLMEPLAPEVRASLAYRWLDRCVRVHAVAALIDDRQLAAAEQLRCLPEIRDLGTCATAMSTLRQVFDRPGFSPQIDVATLSCGFGLIGTLREIVEANGPNTFDVAMGTLISARGARSGGMEERAQLEDIRLALASAGGRSADGRDQIGPPSRTGNED
jgi:hypothetical protein